MKHRLFFKVIPLIMMKQPKQSKHLGHVQIEQNNQLLYADEVSYNQVADEVTAVGHVWLRDKDGNFTFTHIKFH
jgi:lipopolysaccharide assembly outer membrane protein LptD (OstA)